MKSIYNNKSIKSTRTHTIIKKHAIGKKYPAFLFLLIVSGLLAIQSCKKAVDVPAPSNSLVGATVFADNKTATAVLTGIYGNMHSQPGFSDGTWGISKFMGLAADEMRNYFIGVAATQFYTNALSSSPGTYFWPQFFQYIYVANVVLESMDKSPALSANVKQQLTGEAKFIRAFLNFYAVNLYGDIPLVTTTDHTVNNVIKRSPQAEVYKAIIADLLAAQTLLTDDYMDAGNLPTSEKIRPNRTAATALLARTYLYLGDWKNAELQATAVIGNSNYHLTGDLNQVFLKGSDEAIWQLASANATITNTQDAYYFILKSAPGLRYHVSLSTWLLNAFEPGDQRKINWTGSYSNGSSTWIYPYKYKNNQLGSPVTEQVMVLRLAEQYLIRAEARAQLNEPGAADDLNLIRARGGLADYAGATDQASLLQAILHERQIEFFSEWGHRWFDLKRTGNLDAVMGGQAGVCLAKGGVWESTDSLLPLPLTEIQINPNLKQNNGY